MGAPRVSVVVPMRDAGASLPELFDALDAQTFERDRFEVLVVDDGSRDDSVEIARARPGVTVLAHPRPAGSYAARNLAIRQARGEIFAFTDADCRPEPDWLTALLDGLDRLGADLVGGRVALSLPDRPRLPALVDVARHWDQERFVRLQGFAVTANLACRREVIERIGTFAGGLRSDGDREFCVRATTAGFRLVYCGSAVVAHPTRDRAVELMRKTYRHGVGRAQTGAGLWGPGGILPMLIGRSGLNGEPMLRAAGAQPGTARLLAVDAAGYALAAAPGLAGYLAERTRKRPPPSI